MVQSILVTCVGNICRSPMAAALLGDALGERCSVSSAGIHALVDSPADPHAIKLMRPRGLDISYHRARQIDLEIVRSHELILAMEAAHAEWIANQFPISRGRVFRFAHWRDADIADPFRRGPAAFAAALTDIEASLADWIERIGPMEVRRTRR